MPDPDAYVPASPGDLVTAEIWNKMQVKVKEDIASQIAAALITVKNADHATNADQIGGMNLAALEQYIRDQVAAQLIERSGYMQVLCDLQLSQVKEIRHGLGAYPVVDLYQLEYFPAVCAKGGAPADELAQWALFYLYHDDEKRLRIPPGTEYIDIESQDQPIFRIKWMTLLGQFKEQKLLDYTDQTTLDDVEGDFWNAMFKSPPNDQFDPDTYCHSRWFERCCGERRTIKQLTDAGDFDDIYLKMMPRKKTDVSAIALEGKTLQTPEPADVQVSQLDLERIALQLLAQPLVTLTPPAGAPQNINQPPGEQLRRLPLLVLLKI
jgi:hypothetical protein